MWHDMFAQQIPVAEKVLRTVLVYVLIAFLIRVTGKRGLSGLNTLDIVVMTLLSNVVQNAIIGNDLSVTGGAIGAAVLVGLNAAVNRLTVTNRVLAWIFDGPEAPVITDGHILDRELRRLGMNRRTLDHAVRIQNGDDVSQIDSAALEPGGQLVVNLRDDEKSATKGDLAKLTAQLARIEAALATRA